MTPKQYRNSTNWFEIPVTDFNRAKKFYSDIYDYEMTESEMNGNRMGFFPYEMAEHRVGGAIIFGEGYEPSDKGSLVYLNGGDDLNEVLNRVEKAGGKVLMEKTLVTEQIGHFALFNDTEGNRVALHSRK